MNTDIRMTRGLYDTMRRDLARPHNFAAERVGFVRAALGGGYESVIVLLMSYWPVPDDQYVNDPYVGARISGIAIRGAMQDVLSGTHGLFHVHLHDHIGRTKLSRTDQAEIPKLVSSFRHVGASQAHGSIIFTRDHCLAHVWLPNSQAMVPARKVSIVGYPMELLV
jgi:hypothetical protein